MTISPQTAFSLSGLPYPHKGIIGHRGLASLAPENTAASFIAAAKAGLSWVEFDIQLCATGEWVVFHDETLTRTSNGVGRVRETSLTALRALDVGSWFAPHFAAERLLTLPMALSLLTQLSVHPNIEVKLFQHHPAVDRSQAAHDIGRDIQRYWTAANMPLISSFDLDFVLAFRHLYPCWPVGYLVDKLSLAHVKTAREAHLTTLHTEKGSALTYLKHAPEQDPLLPPLPLLAYTVNDATTAAELFFLGISAIFSDKAEFYR